MSITLAAIGPAAIAALMASRDNGATLTFSGEGHLNMRVTSDLPMIEPPSYHDLIRLEKAAKKRENKANRKDRMVLRSRVKKELRGMRQYVNAVKTIADRK